MALIKNVKLTDQVFILLGDVEASVIEIRGNFIIVNHFELDRDLADLRDAFRDVFVSVVLLRALEQFRNVGQILRADYDFLLRSSFQIILLLKFLRRRYHAWCCACCQVEKVNKRLNIPLSYI